MEQDLEADAAREEQHYAKVQAVREQQAEDDAFQEEQSFDRDHVRASPDSADGELGASLEATANSSGEVRASQDIWTPSVHAERYPQRNYNLPCKNAGTPIKANVPPEHNVHMNVDHLIVTYMARSRAVLAQHCILQESDCECRMMHSWQMSWVS